MTVVADSSPLIILAKLSAFGLLPKLYPHVYISSEVYEEVVVAGAGLPGAANVAKAEWIEVRQIQNPAELAAGESRYGIGAGELSTIILARELKAELTLVDDLRARRLAKDEDSKFAAQWDFLNSFTAAAKSRIFVPYFDGFWATPFTSIERC